MPNGDWPGSEYHPLFAVHWEVIIRIKRDNGGSLFVKPLLLNTMDEIALLRTCQHNLDAVNWRTADVLYRTACPCGE